MKNTVILFVAVISLFLSSCHRPVAYFQPMPRPVFDRLPVEQAAVSPEPVRPDSIELATLPAVVPTNQSASADLNRAPVSSTHSQVAGRMRHIQSLLSASTQTTDKQPEPKKKLKLGNKIRQSLGMPLRKELNWWQRISWKLKASVIVLLVAVLFAILHITILAIIFGVVGAFLLISGLKRSFKVRRPWF
ncbi:hypothetical protein [Spirosoma sp. KNUC1025]|uniref:hypothetical protein n=1 Tax=Spirosoma sp. KNUC1025 TaxID=2894082 RepID=UPI0038654C20|nr:hypothetical protein LN737_27690 [Spirosoma sp. KNUC1025]